MNRRSQPGRPRSEVRDRLLDSARTLASGPLMGATKPQLASLAGVPLVKVCRVVDDMRRAGELRPIGDTRSPLSGRRLLVYAPAGLGPPPQARCPLELALRAWPRKSRR